MRVHPEHELDVLAGALDPDAPIGANDLDATPVPDLVPLERAGMQRSKDDVRVVGIELALIPAHDGLFAPRPGPSLSTPQSPYQPSTRTTRTPDTPSTSSTPIALAHAAPHAPRIRVLDARREERVRDDDGERGAPVGRERAWLDRERHAWVHERAEVGGRQLGAWRARRRGEDERLFLRFGSRACCCCCWVCGCGCGCGWMLMLMRMRVQVWVWVGVGELQLRVRVQLGV
jgi:hypothetical protein